MFVDTQTSEAYNLLSVAQKMVSIYTSRLVARFYISWEPNAYTESAHVGRCWWTHTLMDQQSACWTFWQSTSPCPCRILAAVKLEVERVPCLSCVNIDNIESRNLSECKSKVLWTMSVFTCKRLPKLSLWGHHIVPQKAADVNIILSFIEMIGQPKATSNGITKTGRCINNGIDHGFCSGSTIWTCFDTAAKKKLAPKIGQLMILMIFPNEMMIFGDIWWYSRLQSHSIDRWPRVAWLPRDPLWWARRRVAPLLCAAADGLCDGGVGASGDRNVWEAARVMGVS